MAVLGVQLVVTLLMATLMHRLAPHCSFARWLLCNGSLFRYKHPSEEELRALAGRQRPRGRKERCVAPGSLNLCSQRPLPHRLSDAAFDTARLWALVALCLLRLAVTRPHLQAYLCLARARVEQLQREAGRIEAREVQQRVVRVYCYVTVVSLQYLTPLILTLNCTLLLKTLGGYSWGLGPEPAPSLSGPPAQAAAVAAGEDDAQQTAAWIAGALGGLFTPVFLRGLLAYLIWWTAACQLLSSLFGLYFHQHLGGA
ncbi:PREDICTED: transmembrane protein 161A [Dipodomys ordii]|uniref:Transmembrane protein 161A n=1 Tax=Dipodomys ordii TaxID=10020 RepID=A0A1S3G6W4_DIPOR|nr:PREDICTED: transmembrane protein 161A [Dipodomys ordii]